MKAKQAGMLAVILGSACCIGPLLLVAIGVGSGAIFIGRYHWFFIIAAIGHGQNICAKRRFAIASTKQWEDGAAPS